MSSLSLTVFEFDTTNIRTGYLDGEPVFCLKDILIATHSTTTTTQAQSLIEEGIGSGYVIVIPLKTSYGERDTVFVFEAGLTFLLSRSRTKQGKKLNKLIHAEILPSIRKTGRYEVNKNNEPKEKFLLASLIIDEVFKNTSIKPELVSGLKLNAANQLMPELTPCVEPSRQLLINATAQEFKLLTPTDIGKQLGISGQKVNKLLIELGFQTKNSDRKSKKEPAYLPTNRGSEFSDLTLASGSNNDSSTYQQLRWYESILSVLS